MIGTLLNGRYKVIRELKPRRDGKIYYVVQDKEEGKQQCRFQVNLLLQMIQRRC